MSANNNVYGLDEIIDCIEIWLLKGHIQADILSDNFKFISPFWKGNNKAEFLGKFLDPTAYIAISLSKITRFDPVMKFKSVSGENKFAIILQYHTQNNNSVYETVLGTIMNGKLVELRSIYDLNETKIALDL